MTPDKLRARAEQALHRIVRECCPPIYGNFDYAKAVPMLLEFLGEVNAEAFMEGVKFSIAQVVKYTGNGACAVWLHNEAKKRLGEKQ